MRSNSPLCARQMNNWSMNSFISWSTLLLYGQDFGTRLIAEWFYGLHATVSLSGSACFVHHHLVKATAFGYNRAKPSEVPAK